MLPGTFSESARSDDARDTIRASGSGELPERIKNVEI
jgi:hypothetical protein